MVRVAIDGPDAELEAVCRDYHMTSLTLPENQGSYAARNAAIDSLPEDIEIVAFTDSDCIPSPHWIAEHVQALESADMSGGGIDVTLRRNPRPAEFVDRFRHLLQEHYVRGEGYAATANLAVRRDVLDTLRFNPQLRSGGDNDFGRRAREAGFSLVYSPQALVEHPARQSDRDVARKLDRIRTGIRANPTRWNIRPVPFPPLKPKIARAAWRQGISRNPVWLTHAWLLQFWADWVIHRDVKRVRSELMEAVSLAPSPRIGYLLNSYPKISETFVTQEIEELQETGATILVVAVRPGEGKVGSAPTHYLQIPRGRPYGLVAGLGIALTHPVRMTRTLRRLREVSSETGEGAHAFRWWTLFEAGRILRRARVEQLHAHFAWSGAASAYCLAALLDLPWTMTLHANDIFAERRNLEVKLASADRLITVCAYNLSFLRSELGVTKPIDVVVCGVRVPDLPATASPDVDVLAVGRLVPKKGFDTLVEAAALFDQTGSRISVEVIGDGKERAALESLVDAHGLGDSVRFRGAVAHHEVFERMASAKVLVLPARIAANGDRDSMPVVIKEAMARRLPVIATDVGAIPEMVDGSVGRAVEADNPTMLAEAIRDVLALDPESRAQLGEAGRRRVVERYQLRDEVEKLRGILDEVRLGRDGERRGTP